ncbi:MAG TPA: class I SAM-dependent methyltransferase [Parvibaculum sp.]
MTCLLCGAEGRRKIGDKNGYGIFECEACSFRFADPIPTPAELAAIYGKYGANDGYVRKTEAKVARTKKRLARYAHMAPGKRFLDVGCNMGTGVEAARLIGLDAHGIDVGEESIALARKLFPQGLYHAGPIASMPAEWGNFDFVYSSEVIEHLPELHDYYGALVARMKSGALLYITTPDAGHWRVPADFVSWDEVRPPKHLLFFSRTTMARFLDMHGLDVVKFEWNLKPGLKVLARKR